MQHKGMKRRWWWWGEETNKKNKKKTSKVTMAAKEESAWSLCGRSHQEEAECKRKGAAECFDPVF